MRGQNLWKLLNYEGNSRLCGILLIPRNAYIVEVRMWPHCPSRITVYVSLLRKRINSSIFCLFWSLKLVVIRTDKRCIAAKENVFSTSLSLLRIFGAFTSQLLPSRSRPARPPLVTLPFWIPAAEVPAGLVVTGTLWPKRWYFASQVMTVWVSVVADLCRQGTECRAAAAHSRWCFQTLEDGSLILLALRTAREAFLSPG